MKSNRRVYVAVVSLLLVIPSALLGVSAFQTLELRRGFSESIKQTQRLLEQNEMLIETLTGAVPAATLDMRTGNGCKRR